MIKGINKLSDAILYLSLKEDSDSKRAVELITDFIRMNETNTKIGKLDLYECTSSKSNYPQLQGIFYDEENEVAVVTDSFMLLTSKSSYKKELAGKIVGKDGSLIDGRFPKYVSIIESARKPESEPLPDCITTEALLVCIKEYKVQHKISKYRKDDNTYVVINDDICISTKCAKILSKLDLSHIKISKTSSFPRLVYDDGDLFGVFMTQNMSDREKLKRVGRFIYPE